ncbi:excinuclease ABC subunit UvrA [Acetobacter tropicalis]|uniref:UvrABC system protein A n=1 Tax=Acetobacter tropicalis TaxID=104102 RepID=A0A094YSS3_9PROT|nr:excinuclease ABC subunit UvrA [Acetobacter tropicalis]KAA8388156.1 excinuclease ABC subunit UvrA [Acetobacter tropicalis]KAA8390279.1 excinuclease ABC subunit UvrA [Acetobacter tropicalis]KGB24467.1 Excinuclease ABC subunit A [Acetobacter tropicalis]MBC9007427.1 excinuclease ABC subunit UvrA [Acetobacter tropicalis]MDO8171615.1 excinuclease ABC subunit UvrA [Acetobacter tropicalis]
MENTPLPGHQAIRVRGARVHNLKNVDIDIPRDSLTVMTGLSGSGKSSLAFDTIYAEGQRRYVESLSAYARQFLELMGKPDVDSIEGLSPAISIEQKTTSKNPRSTVGTVTEIYDYMRLLWARAGVPYSPATGLPIEAQTVSQMVDRVMALPEGTRLLLLSPVIRDRKGEYRKELAELQRKGFTRVKVDGTLYEIGDVPSLNRKLRHTVEVVIDRIVVKPGLETRLADSFEAALELSDGIAYTEEVLRDSDATPERLVFSSRFSCPESGFTLEEIEPRLFSFNAPQGACPSCDGIGTETFFNPALVVPNPSLSLKKGAIAPWKDAKSPLLDQTLQSLAEHFGASMETPWKDLPESVQNSILDGSLEDVTFTYKDGKKSYSVTKPFEGVLGSLSRRLANTDSMWVREELSRYQSEKPCHVCNGARLRPEALCVKVAQKTIAEASDLPIGKALDWFDTVLPTLTPQRAEIARRILREILERLKFLDDVGLEYLTLSRSSATLSGGESQRIRLASQIGSGLTGVLYVLDEPSIGLHQRDNERLLGTLDRLKKLGNTLIVVEHDEDAIRSADWLIDMGPGAGVNGGTVVAAGTPEQVAKSPESLTGAYLSGRKKIPVPETRRPIDKKRILTVEGASGHNLKNVTARFPLGTFTCVTGVSGSGKSTLVIDTLYKTLSRELMGSSTTPEPCKAIKGIELLDKIIDIDQSPIGRTPRSNPATYTDLFTPIRDWFAELPESKARGYKPGRFSFNVKGGRCEACQGDGVLKIEMHFLPDVFVTCDTCKGKRYNRETLDIKFRGKSIADVLAMSVDEAVPYFSAQTRIRDRLSILQKVGLGYVALGQQATTLSGGEAQRVKLSKELARRATGRTLYILDEPTTGLHTEDVRKLLEVLHALVDQGNTVVVIEHNLEVIKTADWIVDVGPEGGDGGGQVVAEGTPEEIAACPESHTGRFLAPLLLKKPAKKTTKKKK